VEIELGGPDMGLFGPDVAVLARLNRMERQLKALLDYFQIELPDNGLAEVRKLAAAGKKIEAIKLHRQLMGSSLLEAKTYVETET
jgi:ribosomal protein L7/L12